MGKPVVLADALREATAQLVAAAPQLQRKPDDPWLTDRLRAATVVTRAELAILDAVYAAQADTFAELYRLVLDEPTSLTAATPPDPNGMDQARETWLAALRRYLEPILRAVYADRWAVVFDRHTAGETDEGLARAARATTARNRLSDRFWQRQLDRIADTITGVFGAIRNQVLTGQQRGEGVSQLRDRVARVLQIDAYSSELRDRIEDVEDQLYNRDLTGDARDHLYEQRADTLHELFTLRGRRRRAAALLRLAEVLDAQGRTEGDRDKQRQAVQLRREAARVNPDTSRINAVQGRLAGLDEKLYRNPRLDEDTRQQLTADRRTAYEQLDTDRRGWVADAERIARTETMAVLNGGTFDASLALEQETGEPLFKQWLATEGDDRTRGTHRVADGQVQPLRSPFIVGGAELDYPCDPSGPPGEVINCRCTPLIRSQDEVPDFDISSVAPPATPALTATGDTMTATLPTTATFNWVDDCGGLPSYVKRIEKHLERKGMSESRAIATAINAVKKMCATGDVSLPGVQQINAGSRAEACEAVAAWEALKACARSRRGSAVTADAELAADEDMPDEAVADMIAQATSERRAAGVELPNGWRGPLAPLDIRTGDNGGRRRILEAPPDGEDVRLRAHPMPFRWQERDIGGHDGAVVTGRIDRAWVQDGMLWGEGAYDLGGVHGSEAARLLAGGFCNRVSVDITDAVYTIRFETRDGELIPEPANEEEGYALMDLLDAGEAFQVDVVKDWELAAVTQVAISGFDAAHIEPVYDYVPADQLVQLDMWEEESPAEAMAAALELELASEKAWDGSASRFDDDQYQRAAAACDPASKGTVKQRCFLPHHEPDGTLNRAGVHAAAGRLGQLEDRSPEAVAKAKAHLRGHYAELDEDPPASIAAALTAAVDEDYTGGMIALSPSADVASDLAIDGGDPADQLHVTLAFLGDDVGVYDDTAREQLQTAAYRAGQTLPITATVAGYGVLGDKGAVVLFLNGAGLAEAHAAAMDELGDVDGLPDQHTPWVPHLTVGYGIDPASVAGLVGREVVLDTVDVHLANEVTQHPGKPALAAALTAGAGMVFNAADFNDPDLGPDVEEGVVVHPDGRLTGRLARFQQCHIGIGDVCMMAPRSATGYRYFHLGQIDTTDGPLPVGKITLGAGHADLRLGIRAATDHYDNAAAAVAVVRVGEDQHGIWVAGRLLPDVTPAQVTRLQACPLSGDWRMIEGNLELVAALAVVVPGFPVPRAAAASGRQLSLVAAGVRPRRLMLEQVIQHNPVKQPLRVRGVATAQRVLQDRKALQLAKRIGVDPISKADQLLARITATSTASSNPASTKE